LSYGHHMLLRIASIADTLGIVNSYSSGIIAQLRRSCAYRMAQKHGQLAQITVEAAGSDVTIRAHQVKRTDASVICGSAFALLIQ